MKTMNLNRRVRHNSILDLVNRIGDWFDNHPIITMIVECIVGFIIAYIIYYHGLPK